jgi:DNA polymerase
MPDCKKTELINELNSKIKSCHACPLSKTRTHVLCGEGNLNARLLMVALSPGEKEDQANKMFIGPSGKVLDKIFQTLQIHRESVYMTNLIKCMLPKCRRPKMIEIQACSPYLNAEINIINPSVIVPLGFYAARYILSRYQAPFPAARRDFSAIYGNLIVAQNQKIYPLPHPASLLYNPSYEKNMIKLYSKLTSF